MFTYEMFSLLKYDRFNSMQKKEEVDERHSRGNNLVLNE